MKDEEVTQEMIVNSIREALARYLSNPTTLRQISDGIGVTSIIAAAYLTGMAAASGTLASYDGSPIVTSGNFLAAVNEITKELGFSMSRSN